MSDQEDLVAKASPEAVAKRQSHGDELEVFKEREREGGGSASERQPGASATESETRPLVRDAEKTARAFLDEAEVRLRRSGSSVLRFEPRRKTNE